MLKKNSIYQLITDSSVEEKTVMVLLCLLFITVLVVYLERFFVINASISADDNFMNQIKDHIINRKPESAKALCNNTKEPIARLIGKGLSRIGKPLSDIDKSIENTQKIETYRLKKNISVLATTTVAAPMLGFLGTVIGMITAFYQIENSEQITLKIIFINLYPSLITTLLGLVVGIISYVEYKHLHAKIDKVVHYMEVKSAEFLDFLSEPIQ
ncbi:MAG: MotA/TolQ/ExbB proton channel family protein [Tenacibaculum sp.]